MQTIYKLPTTRCGWRDPSAAAPKATEESYNQPTPASCAGGEFALAAGEVPTAPLLTAGLCPLALR